MRFGQKTKLKNGITRHPGASTLGNKLINPVSMADKSWQQSHALPHGREREKTRPIDKQWKEGGRKAQEKSPQA